jgi:hypothetical protein
MESKIIVSGDRSAERLDRAVRTAAGALFEGDFAEATAIRFEESAYVLSKGERVDDARACVAAGSAFRETPAAENAIAQALLEESLGSFLTGLRDGEDEPEDESGDEGGDDALIVKP